MNRAGHPRWAVAATAVLFVLTTGTAALISQEKSKHAQITLGQPQPYPSLNLQASFPVDWEVRPTETLASGQVVIASAPEGDDSRHLFVFRIRPTLLGPRHLRRAAVWPIQAVDPNVQFGELDFEAPGRLGLLESQIFHMVMKSPVLGTGLQAGLANVTVAPDLQILGVLLVVDGRITNRDRRLVEEFSASISYQPSRAAPPGPAQEPLDGGIDELEDVGEIAPGPRVDFL